MRHDFYHLVRAPLEVALPRLLEKVLGSGARAVIRTGGAPDIKALSTILWTHDQASWLPHGYAGEGAPALHPVWLTTEAENPNEASILVLVGGAEPAVEPPVTRILDVFDGTDRQAVEAARARWRAARDADAELHYWQQTPEGGWQERG